MHFRIGSFIRDTKRELLGEVYNITETHLFYRPANNVTKWKKVAISDAVRTKRGDAVRKRAKLPKLEALPPELKVCNCSRCGLLLIGESNPYPKMIKQAFPGLETVSLRVHGKPICPACVWKLDLDAILGTYET